jgi:FixJ family two-component response regulator
MINLSPRELEVANAIANDMTGCQIALQLHISASSVKTTRQHIREKCGCCSMPASIAYLVDLGLVKRKVDT